MSSQPERRRYPRFDARITAKLKDSDDKSFNADVCSISRAGLQLQCNRWTSHRILTMSRDEDSGKPLSISILVSLALPSGESELNLPCQVLASRRLSEDAYQMAIEFTELKVELQAQLDEYLSARE